MSFEKDWPIHAVCAGGDPDALFVQGAQQNIAKRICRGCPVRYECLADALDNRIEFGVWGGMTERERRAILKSHPNVPSWRDVFEHMSLGRQPQGEDAARVQRSEAIMVGGEIFRVPPSSGPASSVAGSTAVAEVVDGPLFGTPGPTKPNEA